MSIRRPARPRRFRFGLRTLFVIMTVVALVLGLVFPAVRAVREAERRGVCGNNLELIGIALDNYHAVHESFPPAFLADPAGQPQHSWRVMLTPFMGSSPFYGMYRWDQPWNSPSNRKLAASGVHHFPEVYHCPDDPSPQEMTSYLAVVGSETAWPGAEPTRLEDFPRGTAYSIIVVEFVNSGVHWMEPRDLEFGDLDFTIRSRGRLGLAAGPAGPRQASSSEHWQGTHVLFADGSVRFLPTETSPDVLKEMLTTSGSR